MRLKATVMEKIKELTSFYAAARDDPRIGTSHISLYMAIFQEFNLNGFENPLKIKRSGLMAAAKISGLATYHKCLRELVEYGYLQYSPSFNPSIASTIIIPSFRT